MQVIRSAAPPQSITEVIALSLSIAVLGGIWAFIPASTRSQGRWIHFVVSALDDEIGNGYHDKDSQDSNGIGPVQPGDHVSGTRGEQIGQGDLNHEPREVAPVAAARPESQIVVSEIGA